MGKTQQLHIDLQPVGDKCQEKPEHTRYGMCAGIIPQCHLPCKEGIICREKGGKSQFYLPGGAIPGTHKHTRTHGEGWIIRLDMLTCRQVTPLPCRKGRRRCKGHGGGQLKREAVGKGIEAPGGKSRAKIKKKRWRMGWSLKTEQKIVNSVHGRGRGAHTSTSHAAHTRGRSSTHSAPPEAPTGPHCPQGEGCPGDWTCLKMPSTWLVLGPSSCQPQHCSPPAAACRPC